MSPLHTLGRRSKSDYPVTFLDQSKAGGFKFETGAAHTETHIHEAEPNHATPGRAGVENSQHHLLTAEEGRQMLIRFCLKRSSFWAGEHLKQHSIVLQAKTHWYLLLTLLLHSHYLLCDVYEHWTTLLFCLIWLTMNANVLKNTTFASLLAANLKQNCEYLFY